MFTLIKEHRNKTRLLSVSNHLNSHYDYLALFNQANIQEEQNEIEKKKIWISSLKYEMRFWLLTLGMWCQYLQKEENTNYDLYDSILT